MLLLKCLCNAAQDAETYSGRVTDAKGTSIGYVTCKSCDAQGKTLSYCITDHEGKYTLPVPRGTNSLLFSRVGYVSVKLPRSKIRQMQTIVMEPSVVALKGIEVQVKPIRQHGDTLIYNVASFKSKDDKYIEDVLKKLPGVKVSTNGSVSYMGKSINQLNIEGQNLMGNRYNVVTRNMPVDAVSQIEVLEDNQPVRALQGKVPSDRATLDIKLNAGYKAKPFGEAYLSGGSGDEILGNGRLTGILVDKQKQVLVNLKANNSGEDISSDLTAHDLSDDETWNATSPLPLISQLEAPSLPISASRYLWNHSMLLTVNRLYRLSQYGSLKYNVSFADDRKNTSDSSYVYYGGNQPVEVFESRHQNDGNYAALGTIEYELNAKQTYLKDALNGSFSSVSQKGVQRGNVQQLDVSTAHHPLQVSNQLQATFNTRRQTYELLSKINYVGQHESMDLSGSPVYTGNTWVNSSRLETDNHLKASLPFFKQQLDLTMGSTGRKDHLQTKDGSYDYNYLTFYASPSFVIRYGKGYVSLGGKMMYLRTTLPASREKHEDKWLFSPEFNWRHTFSPAWEIRMRSALASSASTENVAPAMLRTDYRTLSQMADSTNWIYRSMSSASLAYHNVISLLNWDIFVYYTTYRRSYCRQYTYTEDFSLSQPLWHSTTQKTLQILTSLDKSFYNTGLTLKSSLAYSRMILPIAQNGLFREARSNAVSASAALYENKWKGVNFSNILTGNLTWQDKNQYLDRTLLKSYSDIGTLSLYPAAHFSIRIALDYSCAELSKGHYQHLTFLDMGCQWRVSNGLDLDLKASNLFNRKRYKQAEYNGLDYNYYQVTLRGCEVMAGLRFNF
ncbi:MAG: TonB-dependent receptor [Prevotella sp.]|nr:TonB-dependent receptor [Prevotella sp.]